MNNRKPAPSGALLPQQDGLPPSVIASAIRNTPPTAWRSAETSEVRNMREKSPEPPELRRKQTEAVKTVGARLKASRELSNLSLSEASRRLGYSNPSKLSKVENATDTNSVPLWLIRDAAELYDVSADYIFGLADDWETGIPRGMTGWLADRWEQQRRRDIAAMAALGARIDACAELIPFLAADARDVLDAVRRLDALNPETWPEIRGGGRLYSAAKRLEHNAAAAAVTEKRLKIELTTATTEDEQ